VIDAELGSTPEAIHESFPQLSVPAIKGIIDFARKHEPVG
jgi:uncharacterized protein (DUF433 family)